MEARRLARILGSQKEKRPSPRFTDHLALVGQPNLVIHGVADHVYQRIGDGVGCVAVNFRLFTLGCRCHLFPALVRAIASQAGRGAVPAVYLSTNW